MEFSNPIVGLEELIRSAIKSQDFQTGASGWRIARDGSAEFNSVIIRGIGSGDILIIGQDGQAQVVIGVDTGTQTGYVRFPVNSSVENAIANIVSGANNEGAVNEYLTMQLNGPSVDGVGAGDRIQMQLNSQNNDATSEANWNVRVVDGATNPFLITADINLVSILKLLRLSDELQFSTDVNLYRDNADVLATDDLFRIYRPVVGSNAFSIRVVGDTVSRLFINADGSLNWSDGSNPSDINLFRDSSGGLLKTTGNFSAANYPNGAWTSFTPSWTTSSGANTPSYGNASLDCKWTRHGRTITAKYEIVFGTTTNFGAAPTTGDNWRFGLPVAASDTHQVGGTFFLQQSNPARCIGRARFTTTTATEIEIAGGRVDGAGIANDGLTDSLSPWTWASGNAVRGILTYEAAS